jgi:transcriptional regulator with XRE-family HTH domain
MSQDLTLEARVGVGDRVRVRRRVLGLSQEAIAREAGLSLNQVSRLERGEILDPHLSSLVGIAKALGVSLPALLSEDEIRVPVGPR